MKSKKNKEPLKELIFIGEIVKPHGLKGHLKFFLYNKDSDSLIDIDFVYLSNGMDIFKLEVDDINFISSSPLIKFFDIESRNEADKYRKYKIGLPRSVFNNKDGGMYLFDFIGCSVYFDEDFIGIVKDVVTFSGNDLLLVENNNQKQHYIPINKKLIKLFDIEGRKLIMNNIEGLLDIC